MSFARTPAPSSVGNYGAGHWCAQWVSHDGSALQNNWFATEQDARAHATRERQRGTGTIRVFHDRKGN